MRQGLALPLGPSVQQSLHKYPFTLCHFISSLPSHTHIKFVFPSQEPMNRNSPCPWLPGEIFPSGFRALQTSCKPTSSSGQLDSRLLLTVAIRKLLHGLGTSTPSRNLPSGFQRGCSEKPCSSVWGHFLRQGQLAPSLFPHHVRKARLRL